MCVGQYNKSNVPVGFHMLLGATYCQSTSAIVPSQTNKIAADHDFEKHNLGPYVTLTMNITGTTCESLLSGGVEVSRKYMFIYTIQCVILLMD